MFFNFDGVGAHTQFAKLKAFVNDLRGKDKFGLMGVSEELWAARDRMIFLIRSAAFGVFPSHWPKLPEKWGLDRFVFVIASILETKMAKGLLISWASAKDEFSIEFIRS